MVNTLHELDMTTEWKTIWTETEKGRNVSLKNVMIAKNKVKLGKADFTEPNSTVELQISIDAPQVTAGVPDDVFGLKVVELYQFVISQYTEKRRVQLKQALCNPISNFSALQRV